MWSRTQVNSQPQCNLILFDKYFIFLKLFFLPLYDTAEERQEIGERVGGDLQQRAQAGIETKQLSCLYIQHSRHAPYTSSTMIDRLRMM